MLYILWHAFPLQAHPLSLNTDSQGASFQPEVTVGLATAFQGNRNHIPVGVDALTHIATGTAGGKLNGAAFQQLAIVKDQFDVLTPACALIRSGHGLDQVGWLKAHPDFFVQNLDIGYHGAGQFNTGQIHNLKPHHMFIELFLILILVAAVIALLKPWKW
jgi:hypothetical protein